jgi:hypothetical protein
LYNTFQIVADSSDPNPLPIAAAHHPSYIREIESPVFSSLSVKTQRPIFPDDINTVSETVADRLAVEERLKVDLRNALVKAKKIREEIKIEPMEPSSGIRETKLVLDLWLGSSQTVNFKVCRCLRCLSCFG